MAHAYGKWRARNGEITPLLAGTAEYIEDYERLSSLVTSSAPSVLKAKRSAAVGEVTWGDELDSTANKQSNERIEELDLQTLANELCDAWTVERIAAVHAYTDAEGVARLTKLGGYLEPLYNADIDEYDGLYQCQMLSKGGGYYYRVNIYDWSETLAPFCLLRQWDELHAPDALGNRPDRVLGENAESGFVLRPALATGSRDVEGLVQSPMLMALPQFKSIMATEMRLERLEEFFAYPILAGKGVINPGIAAPNSFWELEESGDLIALQFNESFEALQNRLDSKHKRIARDLSLPSYVLSGANRSAKSIMEENISFYNEAKSDAATLSSLLTEALELYSMMPNANLTPVPVAVLPNLSYMVETLVQGALAAVKEGVLPKWAAFREIEGALLHTLSTEEVAEVMEELKSGVSDEALSQLLAAG